ncbi:MAG: SMP-30/gluconolactonase/LRE family protein [Acidobacteriota bacterium]
MLARRTLIGNLLLGGILTMVGCSRVESPGPLFEQAGDVGEVGIAGSTEFDPDTGTYSLTGGGENVWGTADAFHFAWARKPGDLRLQAEIAFAPAEEGTHLHRKAGWMIRESLEPDAAYADVAVHGDGLVSLQFRRTKGAETEEIQASSRAPRAVRLERTANVVSLWVTDGEGREESVGAVIVELPEEPYVGLFVCSHDAARTETAHFRNVVLENRVAQPEEKRVVESSLEILEIATGRRSVVYRAQEHFEAPNWSRDGSYFLFNQEGRLYTLPVEGGEPQVLDTGFATNCNNDHGFSPDGQWLAISHSPEDRSLIYVLPATGGTPRQVTEKGPSYWHGWSPDGKTLAYCAERNGEFDVYTIPVEGGRERRITTAPGLDDGPDYTPDGKHIYFNSERTGLMKIWRTTPDGRTQEQVTFDNEWADWFPHPSPDGRHVIFLSYDRGVQGHPPNQEVVLRLMPLEGGQPEIVARLFGGQGTINVPSWSPDSRRVAFVSYRLVLPGW